MEPESSHFKRPKTALEVALEAENLESFGYALRDLQHELKRVNNRPQLEACFAKTPILLRDRFPTNPRDSSFLVRYLLWKHSDGL